MEPDSIAVSQTKNAETAMPTTQAGRMRAAVEQAVAAGPGFLRGDIDADRMAHTMVQAVRDCTAQEAVAGGEKASADAEVEVLRHALAELMACGSGYLAGRCDAACVARTMTQMVHEFGPH